MSVKSSRKKWTHKELQSLFADTKKCTTLDDLTGLHNSKGYDRTSSAISSCIDKHRHDTIICVEYDKKRGFKQFESDALFDHIIDVIGDQTVGDFVDNKHQLAAVANMFCRNAKAVKLQLLNIEEEINNKRYDNPFNCDDATKDPKQVETETKMDIPNEVELVRIESLTANICLSNPSISHEDANAAASRIVRGGIASTNDMVANLYSIMNDDVKLVIAKLTSAVEISASHMPHRNMTIVTIHEK